MADVVVTITGKDEASKVFADVGGAISTFGFVAESVAATGLAVLSAGIVALGAAIAGHIALFVSAGLPAIATYERLALTLESLAARELLNTGAAKDMAEALALSADKGEELLNWTQQLAIHSPFTQEGVADALRMALAYGFTVEEAQKLTQTLIDFAAGSGATEYAMQQIARALGQISAAGKLTAQDTNQLVAAGLPVIQILADAWGKTTAEIIAMRADGLIPAKDAIQALTEYMDTSFSGAADRQTKSWAGLLGTFEDLKQIALREYFGGVADALQPLAVEFSNWLQGPGIEILKDMGERLGNIVSYFVQIATDLPGIIDGLKQFADSIGASDVIKEVFAALSDAAAELGDFLIPFLMEQFDKLGAWFDENGPAFIATIKEWAHIFINDVIPAVIFLIELFAEVLGVLFDISLFLGKIYFQFQAISFIDIGKNLWQSFIAGMNSVELNITAFVKEKIVDPIKEFFGIASPSTVFAQIGRDLIYGLIAGIGSVASWAMNAIKGIVATILEPFKWILDALGIDTSSLFGGSGGVGDHDPGRTTPGTPSTGASGTTVNQYFAGATINVGSWDEIIYDCVYPNPFIGSTSGQLTGGGGGTGAPR
jgi:tape measure domain-containing protein